MKVKDYYKKNFEFSSGGIAGEDYREFEKQCKKELKQIVGGYGFTLHKFNKNHYCWSAVLERDGKYVYVSMSDVRWFDWYKVLVRTMKHETDWTGGSNNHCNFDEVGMMADRLSK